MVSGLALLALLCAGNAGAKDYRKLYAFRGEGDGGEPRGALAQDSDGNLYGTTSIDGLHDRCFQGCGTVFKLAPDGTFSVLYAFRGIEDGDGGAPQSGLILDRKGNLYGTTGGGGDNPSCPSGCGTVYRLAPDGTETILYSFAGGTGDGAGPLAGLVRDRDGNLYGTTVVGGGAGCDSYGCGTVFRLSKGGKETLLHVFTGGADGDWPTAGSLIRDHGGNLYGTTSAGGNTGCNGNGCGVVYKLSASGEETVLHAFTGSDGSDPLGLAADGDGNLYGTTQGGGIGCDPTGCGTVFRIAANGDFSVLYAFAGGSAGRLPFAAPTVNRRGIVYGVTAGGGKHESGMVFRLALDGSLKVLRAFRYDGLDGLDPAAPLILTADGTIYGTTLFGGGATGDCFSGCGTVFTLRK
jgi:uncharacterized repeat protein (TIGR03803 family)